MNLKDCLRSGRIRLACLPWRLAAATGRYYGEGSPVHFVIEDADWAIRWVGEHVRDEIEALAPGTVAVTTRPQRLVKRIVHFGSQYMWLSWGRHMSPSNRYVVSFFHGKREDGPEVSRHIDDFLASVPRLARIVTGAGLVEERLLHWGVPRDKIVRIPIGVDTRLFQPPSAEQRAAARTRLGIPDNAVVIGSFQKDGVGWGDGMEPKPIKGPDIFLGAIERLRGELPLVVMLTGPARGYMKQGLERLGVPYVHRYVHCHADLVECYHALDLYIVSSREEGGPMGLMESMSSGVPVVSTRVGMAPDLIADGVSGGLVPAGDAAALADKALSLLALPGDRLAALRREAAAAVAVCDWRVVGRRHLDEVYRPLMGMALEESPAKALAREGYRLACGVQALAGVAAPRRRTLAVYYGGARKGDSGGPLVKVKRLNQYFPERRWGFNVAYLLSNMPYLPTFALTALKRARVPIVYNQNGVFYQAWYAGDWKAQNNRMALAYHAADWVFYQSEFCRLSADRFLGQRAGAGEVLYNAVDTVAFAPEALGRAARRKPYVFLLAGRIGDHLYYRLESTIAGLRLARDSGLDARLTVAGQVGLGARRKCDRLLAELGLGDSIDFVGPYTQETAPALYRSADAYVTTTYNDACPSSVLEALATGLPVLYSNSGGVPELVGTEAGIALPCEQGWDRPHAPAAQHVGQAMVLIAERHSEYAGAARQRAVERFDIAHWIERHREVFERLLAGSRQ